MKRTYDANIGGTIFHVEEDAYHRLEEYLESVKVHFRSYPESADIVADIESRIAEQCAQRSGSARVVTLADVEAIIGVMGSVEQFGDAGASEPRDREIAPAAEEPSRHRWFRDPDERVIAGVAAGLARYFGVAPRWVRFAFLAPIAFIIVVDIATPWYLRTASVAQIGVLEVLAYLGLRLIMPRKHAAPGAAAAGALGPRRLYRDPDDARIAGVAAGLARYCGVTPRAMRLAFLLPVSLLILLTAADVIPHGGENIMGFGILEGVAYLLLWLLIPRAKTSIDKLRMRGHAVTLTSVAQQVRAEDADQTSRSGAAALMDAIGLSVRMLVLGTAWVAGFLLAAWTVVAVIGLTVLLTMVMTNPALLPVTRTLVAPTAMGLKFYPFAVCCYLLAVIPLALIGTTVIAEFQKRRGASWNRPAAGVYVTAVAAWMVALIAWAWLWASSAKPADFRPFSYDADLGYGTNCRAIDHVRPHPLPGNSATRRDTTTVATTVIIERRCDAW